MGVINKYKLSVFEKPYNDLHHVFIFSNTFDKNVVLPDLLRGGLKRVNL